MTIYAPTRLPGGTLVQIGVAHQCIELAGDVNYPAALTADKVRVIVAPQVKVLFARSRHREDLSFFGKGVEVAIHRGEAHVRVGLMDLGIDLVGRRMIAPRPHGF